MSWQGWAQIALLLAVLVASVRPVGAYMARVFEGQPLLLEKAFGWLERLIYRACGFSADAEKREMRWTTYAVAMLLFNAGGIVLVYAVQRLQAALPLNPDGMSAVSPDLSWNTAVSFVTNTNWQSYGGESTMSYFTQMVALAVQNFVCAASGIAVLVALVRGICRRTTATIGNFWVDLTRSTLYVFVPFAFVLALVFVSQGVVQTFSGAQQRRAAAGDEGRIGRRSAVADTGARRRAGRFARGHQAARHQRRRLLQRQRRSPLREPDADQQLPADLRSSPHPRGAHPHVRNDGEGHAAGVGRARGDVRRLPAAPLPLRDPGAGGQATRSHRLHVDQAASALQAGGNMEGKEARFGISASGLYAAATTGASCGAVNSMHDSLTPLGGFVPLFLIQLGEIVFGGVGSGLYGMLVFAVVAVFVAGLMVGRTLRVPGQEDRGQGDEKMASLGPSWCRPCRSSSSRPSRWSPRLARRARSIQARTVSAKDPLRVLVGNREQRQRLRRTDGEHAFLQHHAGPRAVVGPVIHQGPGARARGRARPEEDRPHQRGDTPDAHAALRGDARERHLVHRRRPHVHFRPSLWGPFVEQIISRAHGRTCSPLACKDLP